MHLINWNSSSVFLSFALIIIAWQRGGLVISLALVELNQSTPVPLLSPSDSILCLFVRSQQIAIFIPHSSAEDHFIYFLLCVCALCTIPPEPTTAWLQAKCSGATITFYFAPFSPCPHIFPGAP